MGYRGCIPGVLALGIALGATSVAGAQEVLLEAPLSRADEQRWTNRLCRAAQDLRRRDVEAEVARRVYARALRTGARNTSCAATGLAALAKANETAQSAAAKSKAATLLKQAEALAAAGYSSEADAKVREALAANPAAMIPTALAKPKPMDQAEALAAAGYESEAQAKVREALGEDPDTTIPSALAKPERQPTLVREAVGDAGIWVVTGGLIAAVLLAALALLYTAWRIAQTHAKRRIAVQDFAGGAEGAAAAHVAALQQHSEALNSAHGAGRLDRAAGASDKLTAATNIGALSPQAGAVSELLAMLGRLLPGRTWHLAGDLLPPEPEAGVGLALILTKQPSGKVLSTAKLLQTDFLAAPPSTHNAEEQAVAWLRLALPAAAFVLYEDRRRRRRKDFDKLGTESWRSFAMTVSAGAFYFWDLDTARRLYRQALALDTEYKDARFDLAVVELRAARADEDALAHVANRFEELATSDGVDPRDEPLWYKARFWKTVAQLSSDTPEDAVSSAVTLFDPETTQWWVDDQSKLPSKLKLLLPGMRPMAFVVLATALARADDAAEGELATRLRTELGIPSNEAVTGRRIVKAITADSKLRGEAAYNLACFHARLQRAPWKNEALEYLREALTYGGPRMARFAWDDQGLLNLRTQHEVQFRAALQAAGYSAPKAATVPSP
jgi:hypothetical protein